MSFMLGECLHCKFLEEDLKTAPPKKLAFLSQDMILDPRTPSSLGKRLAVIDRV
jgi:hypothetical protein